MPDKFTTEELNTLLNHWEEGNAYYDNEKELVTILNRLGATHGYNLIACLAEDVRQCQQFGNIEQVALKKKARFSLLEWALPKSFCELIERLKGG